MTIRRNYISPRFHYLGNVFLCIILFFVRIKEGYSNDWTWLIIITSINWTGEMVKAAPILFFADRLPPFVGGMEMHAKYFIEHFSQNKKFPLLGVITKDAEGKDISLRKNEQTPISFSEIPHIFSPKFIFFNSGRWIEKLQCLRKMFPFAKFIYRTGGNEILKAPLTQNSISDHKVRQKFWIDVLNECIDVLVTNSAHTERRLHKLGLQCSFFRCVGGVNTKFLRKSTRDNQQKKHITLFCAARFVPYKNHALLVDIINELVKRGHPIKAVFAGDGPLFPNIKKQIIRNHLESFITLLGNITNEESCHYISTADIYIQLSKDQKTYVEGGSYVHCEGMGRSLLEAVSAGTFVVAGKSGSLSEIVTDERGVLINLDKKANIVPIMEHIFLKRRMRLPFCGKYAWEVVFRQYSDLLERLNEGTPCYRKE